MNGSTTLGGIVTPLITPFEQDGSTVNEQAVRALVEHQVGHGIHALFAAGTTGEVAALDDVQWRRLIRATAEAVNRRIPLIAGVSAPTTGGAVIRARQAAELGATVVTATTPYYYHLNQQEIISHYQALLDATPLPLVLYNIPHLTKSPIAPETVLQLAGSPRIIAIKDSSGDITAARRLLLALRQAGRADMSLLLGTDILIDVTLVMGAQGVVPSLANVAPAVLVAAWEAAATGNWAESSLHLERANRLTRLYQVNQQKMEGGIIPGLKGALSIIGIDCGPPAAPMPALDAAQRQQVEAILREEGVLASQ